MIIFWATTRLIEVSKILVEYQYSNYCYLTLTRKFLIPKWRHILQLFLDISNTIPNTSFRKDIEYSFMFFNESEKYPRPHKASSKTVNPEYIDKLKRTSECRRIWMNDEHQNSVIATFSRGRLANQLSSFAFQYAISKVIAIIIMINAWEY